MSLITQFILKALQYCRMLNHGNNDKLAVDGRASFAFSSVVLATGEISHKKVHHVTSITEKGEREYNMIF